MRALPSVYVVLALLLPAGRATGQAADPGRAARAILDAAYPSSWSHDEILARVATVFAEIAHTPLAETLASRWVALARQPGVSPTVWRTLSKLAADPSAHGRARLVIRGALAARMRDRGEHDRAAEIAPARDHVGACLAIGPFGDSGTTYHGVPFPPEYEEPDLTARMDGRFERVGYRRVRLKKDLTHLDLAPEGDPRHRGGCHYAWIQLKSAAARDAWLEFGCPGSFETWWNGRPLAMVNRSTQKRPLLDWLPVRMRAGWNRFLVKLTAATTSTFSLRIVDARGSTMPDLGFEPERVLHAVAASEREEQSPPAFHTARKLVQSWLAQAEDDASVLALAAMLETQAGATDVALDLARRALAAAPSDTRIQVACLETWKSARHIPSDVRRTEERRILDGMDPGSCAHRHLFQRKIERLFEDDSKEEALTALEARLAKNPDEIPTLHQKYRLLTRLGWHGEARRTLDNLLILVPHHVPFVLDAARLEDREGNPKRALARIQSELERQPGRRDLLGRALSLARKMGKGPLVARYLAARHRDEPTGPAAVKAQAALDADQSRYGEAAAKLERLAETAAAEPGLHKRIGDLHYLGGNSAAALRHYRRSLALRPDQHELRSWILRMAGVPEFIECRPYGLDPMAEVAAFGPRAEDSAAPATLVLDQMVIRVYEDGSQMEETHILRRINDHRGVERYEQADQAARASELLELRTILPDGSWFAPHRVGGTFSMPRLTPGAFIEEHYRNYKPSPGLEPIDFIRFIFRGLEQPYRFSRLVVLMPKHHKFGEFVQRNFPAADRQEQDMDELTAHVFTKKDMPKIDQEVGMPPVDEIAPWVTFGQDRDLAPFLRQQRTWFDHMTIPYLEIRQKTQRVCNGLQGDLAKARAIHELAHDITPDQSTRYGSPYPVSVLLKQEGDRFPLQLAMLREAGIPWTPAVLHPRPPEMETIPEPFLDPASYFSVRAAWVQPRDGRPFWIIEGTPRHYPFGELPAAIGDAPLSGCPYLLLEGTAGVSGTMPGHDVRALAVARIKARVTVKGQAARIEADIEIPGTQGYLLKERLRSLSRSRRQLLARSVASTFFGRITIRKVEFLGLDAKGEPASIRLRLERKGILEREGQTLALPPLFRPSGLTERFGGRGGRTHPLLFNSYRVTDWELTIDPGQHRFAGIPPGLFIRRMILDYGLSYALAGTSLKIRRVMILRPGRVPPDRYKEFLDLCRQIDSVETRRIRILP